MPGWGDSLIASAWDWPLFGYAESSLHGNYRPNFSEGHVAFQVNPSWVGKPLARSCDYRVLQGPHPEAMMVALGDGSVRSVTNRITLKTWLDACHPADGATLGSDW